MKLSLLFSLAVFALAELDAILNSANAYVELGVKVFGLAAAVGAAWRWLIGPGYQRGRGVVAWVQEQLEMITTLDNRLDGIEENLSRGAEHFDRIDKVLESLASEEAKAIRHALHTGQPVEFTEEGAIDRRGSVDRRDVGM